MRTKRIKLECPECWSRLCLDGSLDAVYCPTETCELFEVKYKYPEIKFEPLEDHPAYHADGLKRIVFKKEVMYTGYAQDPESIFYLPGKSFLMNKDCIISIHEQGVYHTIRVDMRDVETCEWHIEEPEPEEFDYYALSTEEQEAMANLIQEMWVDELKRSDVIRQVILDAKPVLSGDDTLTVTHDVVIGCTELRMLAGLVRKHPIKEG